MKFSDCVVVENNQQWQFSVATAQSLMLLVNVSLLMLFVQNHQTLNDLNIIIRRGEGVCYHP